MRPSAVAFAIVLAVVAGCSRSLPAEDWPQFRGPEGTGVSGEKGLPVEWGPERNIRWKAPLPAESNGSPIVSNGRVFATTATESGTKRHLHCFDRRDGRELWTRTVEYTKDDPTHKTNPYAATTPAANGEVVVVFHGSAGISCYDFGGRELWSRDLGEFLHIWGYASSPVIYGDRVIVNAGPGERQFLAALDLASGETLWQHDEPGGASGLEQDSKLWIGSWSTPVVTKVEGEDQILCSMPTRVISCDPKTGEVLWHVEGLANLPRGNLVYTSPVIGDGIAVVLGGFNGPAIGFTLGGSGDVTETNRLWRVERANPQRIGSGVIIDGDLYHVNADSGTAECIDARTGKQKWKARVEGGGAWGSTLYAEGRLYVTVQDGTTHVFLPNPEKLEIVASNSLGEPSNATPAFSDGEIFLKTAKHLYCIAQ